MYINHCTAHFSIDLLRFFFVRLCGYLYHLKMYTIVHILNRIMRGYIAYWHIYIHMVSDGSSCAVHW